LLTQRHIHRKKSFIDRFIKIKLTLITGTWIGTSDLHLKDGEVIPNDSNDVHSLLASQINIVAMVR